MSVFDKQPDDRQEQHQELSPEEAWEALVGEGKKFKTPQDLAKSYAYLDAHRGVLEDENKSLRENLTKAASLEEVLAKIEAGKQPAQQQQQPTQQPAPGDTPVDIEALVAKLLDKRQSETARESNINFVDSELTKMFGSAAAQAVSQVERELGIDLKELAATSPKAALAVFAGKSPSSPQSEPFRGTAKPSGQSHGDLTTKSGILAMAKQQNWSKAQKYKVLNAALAQAARNGTLEQFNS